MFAKEFKDKQSHYHLLEHRDTLADDANVTWLDDFEEYSISDIWMLSMEPSIDGICCNYQVVKDSSRQYGFNHLEVYGVCKRLTNILNEK